MLVLVKDGEIDIVCDTVFVCVSEGEIDTLDVFVTEELPDIVDVTVLLILGEFVKDLVPDTEDVNDCVTVFVELILEDFEEEMVLEPEELLDKVTLGLNDIVTDLVGL